MKIAHVFPSEAWGGAEIYVVQLAEAQRAAGLDVVVWGKPDSPMILEAQKRGLATLIEPVPYRLGLGATTRLSQIINRENVTHLHCHWSGGPWAFLWIKRKCNVKVIYHIHMWISARKTDPLHAYAYRKLDAIIVAGERARLAALNKLSVKSDQLRVCNYFIDDAKFARLSTNREKWGLPEDSLVFGMFARLDRQKGSLEFARALVEILPKHKNAVAVIMGDSTKGETDAMKYSEEVDQILADPRLQGRVIRLPFRSDYLEVLRNCDVLVAPSYNESYSLILLDAFALGVPVVSTNAGGTPDLVDSTRGWIVEPKSVHAIADALESICASPNDIARRGEAGREYVKKNHLKAPVLKSLESIY